jgi:hypothetical protein
VTDALAPPAPYRGKPTSLSRSGVLPPQRIGVGARAANNAAQNATFSPGAEPAFTGPGSAAKNPICVGPGAPASRGESSNRRTSLAFSARSRATSACIDASSTDRSVSWSVVRGEADEADGGCLSANAPGSISRALGCVPSTPFASSSTRATL